MSTKLTKPVSRESAYEIKGRPIIITIAPCGGSQIEARIGLRLKGKRTMYIVALSDVYRNAALHHGLKEKRAKSEARKLGVSWRIARKQFIKGNTI